MQFVFFHGSFGNPQENWFPELKKKLEQLGQSVLTPEFPVENWDELTKNGPSADAKNQNLSNWLKAFKKILHKINRKEKLCFVGHSLGPLFILHVVQTFGIQLDCAIFVSPFFETPLDIWQFDKVNKSFYSTSFDFEKLKKLIPTSYVLYSDTDPYVNRNQEILFGRTLESSTIFVRKAGHMGGDVKLSEFPLVFDLCTTRLDLSLYQTYLLHINDMHSSNYIRSNYPTTIHLRPEYLDDEGNFHFKNLKESGFATFLSGGKDWDPHSQYYEDGRIAAKRLKYFSRVILVEKLSDLKREILLEQIKADLAGGISVYLCMIKDIKEHGKNLDFGIWDEDYTCTILYDKNKNMKEFFLDSRESMMKKANKLKEVILNNAIQIKNSTSDVKAFIASHTR